MFCTYSHASAASTAPTTILTLKAAKKWLRVEFQVFKVFLKTILDEKCAHAKGNPFAQGVHDGGTLSSKRKYQAFGIQFIDPKWRRNLVFCVGFERCGDGRDVDVADKLREALLKKSGHRFDDIVCSVMQDKASKGVFSHLGLDEEVCGMHDGDKIGQSAVDCLFRSKNKTPVNPFPEGQALMKKAHALGTYFSYSNRHGQLMSFRMQVKDLFCHKTWHDIEQTLMTGLMKLMYFRIMVKDQSEIMIKVDLNTTRVAAQHSLLHSELLLNRLLRLYTSVHNDAPQIFDSEWDSIAEIEGVLNISKDLATLMQYEHSYNGSFGQIIKHVTLKRIRASYIPVIDMPNVTNSKVRKIRAYLKCLLFKLC